MQEVECVCVPLRQVCYGCVVQRLMPEAVGCLRWEACAITCNGKVPLECELDSCRAKCPMPKDVGCGTTLLVLQALKCRRCAQM